MRPCPPTAATPGEGLDSFGRRGWCGWSEVAGRATSGLAGRQLRHLALPVLLRLQSTHHPPHSTACSLPFLNRSCASKDPWTDPVACKAWLPWGDCRKCSTKWYRYSCCDNKPWGSPGCNWDDWDDHKHGPIVGATCGSR